MSLNQPQYSKKSHWQTTSLMQLRWSSFIAIWLGTHPLPEQMCEALCWNRCKEFNNCLHQPQIVWLSHSCQPEEIWEHTKPSYPPWGMRFGGSLKKDADLSPNSGIALCLLVIWYWPDSDKLFSWTMAWWLADKFWRSRRSKCFPMYVLKTVIVFRILGLHSN